MGPITAIIPVPRVVPCAGQSFHIAEFTLRDVARLQSLLDEEHGDPLAEIQDALPAARGDDRRKLLVAAYEKAEIGPLVYGDSGREFFASPTGAALFLWVALSRLNPGVTPEIAAQLFARCSAGEYGRIWRICHGIAPLRVLADMLMPIPGGQRPPGRTWPEMIDELAAARNWTYEYIYGLTLTEWLFARNGGKAPEIGRVLRPGEDWAAIIEAQRRAFYGDDAG